MKAVATSTYGTAETMRFQEVPIPEPNKNQLLIKVHACSVNPIDWKILRGDFKIITGRKPPLILGGDYSGTVEKCGTNVNSFAVGDAVWGHVNAIKGGAYAQYILAGLVNVDHKPANLSFEEAAAVPLAGLTAYQALVDHANLSRKDRVLINGCTGGTGTIAIQIARALGCNVTGICSNKNVELATKLGCDQVVDYQKSNILTSGSSYDVLFDAVGTISFNQARKLLPKGGRYVTTIPSMLGLMFGTKLNILRSREYHGFLVHSSSTDLAAMRNLSENGQLSPVVEHILPISQIVKAHKLSMSGRTVGKIVLKTAEDTDWI
jgi:NADPH:quinone reductase-like Zn-dependent oxidoreductase